jgi:hypothetical protein
MLHQLESVACCFTGETAIAAGGDAERGGTVLMEGAEPACPLAADSQLGGNLAQVDVTVSRCHGISFGWVRSDYLEVRSRCNRNRTVFQAFPRNRKRGRLSLLLRDLLRDRLFVHWFAGRFQAVSKLQHQDIPAGLRLVSIRLSEPLYMQ